MHVLQLKPTEQVVVDQDRLGVLYHQLGEAGAEDVVCRALEELAQRLGRCDRLYRDQDRDGLRKNSRLMLAIAEQIGMKGLARVAQDVTQCLDSGDNIALASTLSRLIRVGERSLTAVWDIDDLPL